MRIMTSINLAPYRNVAEAESFDVGAVVKVAQVDQ